MANDLQVPEVVSESLVQVEQANVENNLQRVQAFLAELVTQFNRLNAEVAALDGGGGGGGGPTTATLVTVDTTNFTQLLAGFSGTNLQQLLDFIDGLQVVAQPQFTSFATNLVGTTTTPLATILDQPITVSYEAINTDEIATINLIINGIRVADRPPIAASVANEVIVPSAIEKTRILAVSTEQFRSQLSARLKNGATITSNEVTLQLEEPMTQNFLYAVVMPMQDSFDTVTLGSQVEHPITDPDLIANFTLPVAPPLQDPNDVLSGWWWALLYPSRLTLSRLINQGSNTDEINSWGVVGTRTVNGEEYEVRRFGPLVEGAVITYEADFSSG